MDKTIKQDEKKTGISEFFNTISTLSQNASIHFDNMYYAVNTALQNSLRRKGNKVMKPKRAKIKHILKRDLSVQQEESMQVPLEECVVVVQGQINSNEQSSSHSQEIQSSVEQESVESQVVEQTISELNQTHKEPQLVQSLLDTSLDRIRKLEKQVQDLESCIQSALSSPPSPLKSVISIPSTPITPSIIHKPSPNSLLQSNRVVHPPIMMKLLDELKTHQLIRKK